MFFISYNKIKSKGFSSAYDSTGKSNFDKDGFSQDVLHLNYTFTPFKKTSVRLFGKYNNNHADLDAGAFMDDKDYTNHNNNVITGMVIDKKVKKGFIRLQYAYNRFNRNFLDDSTDVGWVHEISKRKVQRYFAFCGIIYQLEFIQSPGVFNRCRLQEKFKQPVVYLLS